MAERVEKLNLRGDRSSEKDSHQVLTAIVNESSISERNEWLTVGWCHYVTEYARLGDSGQAFELSKPIFFHFGGEFTPNVECAGYHANSKSLLI